MPRKRNLSIGELGENRELYFETCLKIVKWRGGSPVPLVLKPEQRRLFSVIDHERRQGRAPKVIILKGRRVGMSTAVEAELFRMCHARPNRNALVVAHDSDSVETIFGMSKLFYDELPPAVKPPTRYSTKKLIDFAHNRSRMQVVAAGGRGFTAQYLHISELAFVEDADTMMTAILQTAPEDPDSLIVAESTPNGLGNYFHNLWVNAVGKKNGWVPFFSPWFEEPSYRMNPWFDEKDLSAHDARLMQEHNLSLDQIAWYVSTRENRLNGDQDKMDQEYASDPASCFLASGRKAFDQGLPRYLDELSTAAAAEELPPQVEIEPSQHEKRGVNIRVVKGGRWRIYRPPQLRHSYIVGADIASGDPGGDYTPLVTLNRMTLDVDAVFYARLHPDLLARMAALIGYWYNTAKIAGEANNQGILFHDELIRRIQYPHVHYRLVNEESVARKVSQKPGVWTHGENRESILGLARRYVRDHSGRCLDPDLIKEWQEAFYDDANRVDHPKGGYLDGTVALAMALYAHHGSTEGLLQPIPVELASRALAVYHENKVRASMGLPEQDIDIGQLTMDEIARMDDARLRRERSRERSGLGGYR
jgi:hypothetical protein